MRMLPFIALLVLPAAASAATSDQAETQSFERDGHKYVYTVREEDGARRISGRAYPSGKRFNLLVKNGRVRGTMDNNVVHFSVPETQSAIAEKGKPQVIGMR